MKKKKKLKQLDEIYIYFGVKLMSHIYELAKISHNEVHEKRKKKKIN